MDPTRKDVVSIQSLDVVQTTYHQQRDQTIRGVDVSSLNMVVVLMTPQLLEVQTLRAVAVFPLKMAAVLTSSHHHQDQTWKVVLVTHMNMDAVLMVSALPGVQDKRDVLARTENLVVVQTEEPQHL